MILAAAVIAAGASACRKVEEEGASGGDFRKAKWRMTKDEVKASEKLPVSEELPGVVTYVDELGGKPAIIGYVFNADGQLMRAGYLVDNYDITPKDYVAAFEKARKDMGVRLGKPSVEGMEWASGVQDEMDPEKFAEAACAGRLQYAASWINDRTAVSLTLDGEEGHCKLGAMYDSMDLYVVPTIVEKKNLNPPPPTPGPGAE